MPRINLLPWREELRKERQKNFTQISLLFVLLAALLSVVAGQLIEQRIDVQRGRNQLITTHIDELNREIQEVRALRKKRDQLLSWIDIVQNLQADRGDPVKMFNDIATATTAQLYLTRIQKEGNLLTLEGEAAGNREISLLMRSLAQSEILQDPTLTDVSASTVNAGFNHFTLQVFGHSQTPASKQEAK